jgi:rubrerythrin
MLGAIRKRDILAHPIVTVQCFGWKVFFRVLLAGRDATFLSIVAASRPFRADSCEPPELVSRCIELERSAMRIYRALADRLEDEPEIRSFFRSLASQEEGHAEMLALCHRSVRHGRWMEQQFRSMRSDLERLEDDMLAIEKSANGISSARDALRLVIGVESSEINRLFQQVVAACPSEFVRSVERFWDEEQRHLAFICARIETLVPDLVQECAVLKLPPAFPNSDGKRG